MVKLAISCHGCHEIHAPAGIKEAIGDDMDLCSSKAMGLDSHVATGHSCLQWFLTSTVTSNMWSHPRSQKIPEKRHESTDSCRVTVSKAALLSKFKWGFSCCKWLLGAKTPHMPERRSRCNEAIPAHSVA